MPLVRRSGCWPPRWLGRKTSRVLGTEEIKPPFGLHWGETTARLERLLSGAHAKVLDRRTVEGREAWNVEGILTNDLQRTVFYFSKGELVEVELQYKTADWSEEKYNTFMSDVRDRLEKKYGPPELIARREEPHGTSGTMSPRVSTTCPERVSGKPGSPGARRMLLTGVSRL